MARKKKKQPWNKGCKLGQKPALTRQQVWEIRIRLIRTGRKRDLVLLNLAIDSKLMGDDLVRLRVCDVRQQGLILTRATITQRRNNRPIQFEVTDETRASLQNWLVNNEGNEYLFPSRFHAQPHLSVRQYARITHEWIESIGLDSSIYGTHSLRRTKVAMILEATGDLLVCQKLLGHKRVDTTMKYLGVTTTNADALEVAERIIL